MTGNQTVTYFIIKGLSDDPNLQAPIFVLVLLIYLISLFGNMTLFILVCLDSHLHTPMYFFLANLSIVDMTSCTVTLHKTLLIFITGDNTVPYLACMVEFYLFAVLIGHEVFILTAMSYDRYVAICRPLNYKVIMNFKVKAFHTSEIIVTGPNSKSPLKPSRHRRQRKRQPNNTSVNKVLPVTTASESIIKIRSSIGRRKAFYTCSSHITVIVLLYTTLTFQYLTPGKASGSKKWFSLFNTAIIPLLNPLIYSLRNKDVKKAFRRRIGKCETKTHSAV
ncbi:olfactory receptor 5B12-like [Dendropsophus ebraccatus]|uniref:olfactory receptor 5B12-like n=1 Tax=Dendropsophus ebraccatus TaxID=150705 RepID=UPI003831756F